MNTNVELSHRMVTAELHCTSHKSSSIIKETCYAARTVNCTVASLKQGNSIQRKTHSPRCDKKVLLLFEKCA